MRIQSIAAAFPKRQLSNDAVIDLVAKHSRDVDPQWAKTQRVLSQALKATGAVTRRWREAGETSLEMVVSACQQALADANHPAVDLLLYASVYPELVEPSSANRVAHALGLHHTECLDIKEACDGWMKAVKLADALMRTGRYRRILVVNNECPMTPGMGVWPELFRLSSLDQLEHRFPTYTLGEVATATLLESDGQDWAFDNITRNDWYDFCTITPPWYTPTQGDSPRLAKDGAGLFTSYGALLRQHGFPTCIELFQRSGRSPADVDILFTHSSSKRDWTDLSGELGLAQQQVDIYAEYGNVVSAAVPAAMAVALQDGRLQRGQRVLALVASAGMSFSTAWFQF